MDLLCGVALRTGVAVVLACTAVIALYLYLHPVQMSHGEEVGAAAATGPAATPGAETYQALWLPGEAEEPNGAIPPTDAPTIAWGSPTPTTPEAAAPTPLPTLGRTSVKPFTYRVAEGDSLLVIAQKFGITPETVLWANEIPNPEVLAIGQELTILPISGVQHRVAGEDTVASIAEMYCAEPVMIRGINGLAAGEEPSEGATLIIPGGMRRTPDVFEPPPDSRPSEPVPPDSPSYSVRPGDTLVSIADAFGVRPSTIQAANGLMDPDLLQVGQLLAVPGGTEPRATTVAPSATATPPSPTAQPPVAPPAPLSPPTPAASTPTQVAQEQAGRYTVKQGDTVYSIARAVGVSPSALASANAISDPGKLAIGQTLVIPGAGTTDGSAAAPPTATPTQQATAAPTVTPTQPAPTTTPTPLPPTAVPTRVPPAPTQPAGPPAAPPPAGGSAGDRIAAIAQKYLGYRYVWGGDSTAGFDCSGFTWYVYREAGITIPQHDLAGQLGTGQKIARDKLLPGDLVFFENTYMKGLSHVGIYLGSERFINAESEATGVQIRSLADPNWASRYVGASRPW